jgi:hypothetical protein
MPSKNTNQVIKSAYHVIAVIILTSIFIFLNVMGLIHQNSQPPVGLEATISLVLSVQSLYMLPFVFLLLISLAARLKGKIPWKNRLKTCSFWVLSAITGKFYTWGAFFLAWELLPYFVSYVPPFPNAYIFGLMSIMLGWVFWLKARSLAIWLLGAK